MDEESPSRKRNMDEPAGVVFRLLVPNHKIGQIIGKEGANIKQLREETGARIKISSGQSAEDRIILLSSKDSSESVPTSAEKALFALYPKAMETNFEGEREGKRDQYPVVKLLVPASQAGPVLGKSGANIKQLRESSGANIKLLDHAPSSALQTDRVLQVSGTEKQIEDAIQGIAVILREHPPKESIYDFDNFARGGAQTQPAYFGGAGFTPGWPYAPAVVEDPFKKRRSGDSMPAVVPLVGQPQLKAEMRLASAAVGAIIGRGGTTIKNIRQLSGANIKVDKVEGADNERLVEITGNQSQVAAAQSLIQACMSSVK